MLSGGRWSFSQNRTADPNRINFSVACNYERCCTVHQHGCFSNAKPQDRFRVANFQSDSHLQDPALTLFQAVSLDVAYRGIH